jgi:hypothetical protein
LPPGRAGTTLAPVSTATPSETVPTTDAAQPEAPPERGWFRPWMLLFPLVPAGLMLAVIVGLTQGERPVTQRFFAQVRLGRGPAAAALATDALAAEVQQCLLSACETGASAPALRLLQAGAHEDLQRVVPVGDGRGLRRRAALHRDGAAPPHGAAAQGGARVARRRAAPRRPRGLRALSGLCGGQSRDRP